MSNQVQIEVVGNESAVQQAVREQKTASGWSLPLSDKDAMVKYADTLKMLYKYYAPANEALYSLVGKLGATSGWNGKFPTEYQYQRRTMRSRSHTTAAQ